MVLGLLCGLPVGFVVGLDEDEGCPLIDSSRPREHWCFALGRKIPVPSVDPFTRGLSAVAYLGVRRSSARKQTSNQISRTAQEELYG